MLARSATVVLALALAVPSASYAQCADGTPPPCASARVAIAPRPALPALDDHMWIVVPFDNTARNAEIEWLRDASVNLLSLDLSRWNDIRVVDDKRVADYLRGIPAANTGSKLSLNDGLAVARRAGAGRLVMGDVLKLGNLTRVSATVYDVKKGERVRTTRAETSVVDSLMPLFGKIARGVLAVAPPEGANVGAVGTSRADAYQEYLAGVVALNRFDAAEAKSHLDKALQLDTAFALAHYKWAIASLYDGAAAAARMAQMKVGDGNLANLGKDPARLAHATAAARLSGSLPPRERALINGLLAEIKYDHARACEAYGAAVRADSSDVEALFGLGTCLASDDVIVPVPGDTTYVFRTSWNTALRVLRRAIRIDPLFHHPFGTILNLLTAPARFGCPARTSIVPCTDSSVKAMYYGLVVRAGDSLVTVPKIKTTVGQIFRIASSAERSPGRRRSLEDARAAAEEWVAAGPREGMAHVALSKILLRLGRTAESEAQFLEATGDRALAMDPNMVFFRVELALKLGRGKEVNRLFDSLDKAFPVGIPHASVTALMAVTGRVAGADTVLGEAWKGQLPPFIVRAFLRAIPLTLGGPTDSVVASEIEVVTELKGPCGGQCKAILSPSLMFGLRLPRASWPPFDSTAVEPRLAPAVALARHDTVQFREATRVLDSISRASAAAGLPEDGSSAIAADAQLILGDTLAALNSVRRMLDSTLVVTSSGALIGAGVLFADYLWPRGMLLRAELAAARGENAESRLWYGRFIDLWAKADPRLQPTVDRARKALATLGN